MTENANFRQLQLIIFTKPSKNPKKPGYAPARNILIVWCHWHNSSDKNNPPIMKVNQLIPTSIRLVISVFCRTPSPLNPSESIVLLAVRETASLGIMGAPRVPPLNPSETIVLSAPIYAAFLLVHRQLKISWPDF